MLHCNLNLDVRCHLNIYHAFQKLDQFNEVDIFYHQEDDYDISFDYYDEEYNFFTTPKNTFDRIFSMIPILSERQAGVLSILGPIFAGILGLVTFSGKILALKIFWLSTISPSKVQKFFKENCGTI